MNLQTVGDSDDVSMIRLMVEYNSEVDDDLSEVNCGQLTKT